MTVQLSIYRNIQCLSTQRIFLLTSSACPLFSSLILFIIYLVGVGLSCSTQDLPASYGILSLQRTRSRLWCLVSAVAARRLNYPSACGTLVPQKARNLCPLHCKWILNHLAPPRKAPVSLIKKKQSKNTPQPKLSLVNAWGWGSIPESGRSPGEGNSYPTPVFLPRESHEQSSLVDYSPWGCKELDITEPLSPHTHKARLSVTKRRKGNMFIYIRILTRKPWSIFFLSSENIL